MAGYLDADDLDKYILMACRLLLKDGPVFATAVSLILREYGHPVSAVAVGRWLRRSKAFKRHRRWWGNLWTPLPTRLERLYREHGL
ncbi:MAG: hypothetical protein WBF66_07290 [Dehalococcoidia bacterium]